MKKFIIIFQCLFSFLFIHQQLQSQSYSAANWAWGKDFNPSTTQPPKMCYDNGFAYTAGEYDSTLHMEGQIFPNNGGKDIYLAKWDTAGNLVWVQTISQSNNQYVSNIHVKNNKLVLTGRYNSSSLQVGSFNITNNGLYDIFIAIFDTNGTSTALYNYGNTGNDNIRSSCIDNNFNVYVAGDSLYKFSALGIKQWNKNYNANQVFYSTIDSSIVLDGNGPAGWYTSGATGFTYFYNDVIIRKLNLQGDSVWKTTFTIDNGNYFTYTNPGYYISDYNQISNTLYLGHSSHYHLSQMNYAVINTVAPNGSLSYIYTYPNNYAFATFSNISTNKNFVAFTMNEYGSPLSTYILNSSTNGIVKEYINYSPQIKNSYEFVDTNLIFAHGDNGLAQHTFGKFGKDTMQILTSSEVPACLGSTTYIYPIIVGGTPPYTYSWLPTTGLNSTSTLITSFTATTNTTYTFTVTDANNYSCSKAFNVNIGTPLNINITAQYPILCDSMQLFSNTGSTGYWTKNTTPNNTFLGQGENFTIYSSGQYIFEQQNQCGWFSDTIDIISGNSTSTTNVSLCWSQLPYVWNGQNLTTNGIYTDTSVNSLGCDSIATLNLTVKPTTFAFNTVSLCSNQLPYVWNGQNLTTSGIYTDTSTNSLGCDSVSTLEFMVIPTTSSNNILSLCSNQLPYVWNGQNLTASGTYADTSTNSMGCDSIATLQLTVKPISTSSNSVTICSNQLPYVWNGQNLTTSGNYTNTALNSLGCDSVATLQLTVNPTSSSTNSISVCSNQLPYSWNGQNLTTSGTYTDTFTNSVGCDSVASLQLTVNPTSSSSNSVTICSNQLPYVWNGQNLTISGSYTYTSLNSLGCDSVATLQFTVNPTSSSSNSVTICSNQLPYVWNGQNLTMTGNYTYTSMNSIGCDSVATLQFTVNPTSSSSNSVTICSNQLPYVWNGQNLTTSGTYTHTSTNSLGCDSVATLQFTVNPISSSTNSMIICSNLLPYSWNGQNLTTSGTYAYTSTNSVGCDSISILQLTINPTSSLTNSVSICSNQLPYVWNGQNLTASGNYTDTSTNSLGCDSISILQFIVNPTSTSTNAVSICSNQLPYVWNGQNLTTSGTYSDTSSNSLGCDSIATLQLTVNPIPLASIFPNSDTSICIGTNLILIADSTLGNMSWSLNGNTISSNDTISISMSGNYVLMVTDSNSCMSTDTVSIIINPAPQPVVTFINHQLICTNVNNVNYDWYMNGQSLGINSDTLNLTQNGWYWVITTDSSGCMGIDSIQVINLSSEIIHQKIDDVSLYPNPTSQSISIDYTLQKVSNVSIKIMDVVGNMITSLQKKNQASGHYSENIDLSPYHLSNGVYLIQLSNGVTNWNLPFVFRQ